MADPRHAVQQHLERQLRGEPDPSAVISHLEGLSPAELTTLLPGLYGTGEHGEARHALRDTVAAVLYRKLTDSHIEAVRSLDASTERLSKVGWWLTIVVGAVGVLASLAVAL